MVHLLADANTRQDEPALRASARMVRDQAAQLACVACLLSEGPKGLRLPISRSRGCYAECGGANLDFERPHVENWHGFKGSVQSLRYSP